MALRIEADVIQPLTTEEITKYSGKPTTLARLDRRHPNRWMLVQSQPTNNSFRPRYSLVAYQNDPVPILHQLIPEGSTDLQVHCSGQIVGSPAKWIKSK